MIPCVVIGGGGHARVVIDALRRSGSGEPRGIVDAATERWGTELDGVKILGGDDKLKELSDEGVTHFLMGLAGAGNNLPRRRLFEAALALGFTPFTLIHPSAIVSPAAHLGAGVQVLALAAINAGACLGANVVVNTGAIIEHDCQIGAHVHLASRACLGGGVLVGEAAHIGAGSVIRQGCTIGAEAIVGVGAAVVADVPPKVVVGGVPAHILKAC